jgi:ribosomal protein S18 acetylase RimI-like enzyme
MITILSPLDYHLLGHPIQGEPKCIAVDIRDNIIVGRVAYHEVPHIGDIYVHEQYRNQNIASNLIKRIEQIVPEYYTFPSNDASRGLFRKLGLKELPDLRIFVKEK